MTKGINEDILIFSNYCCDDQLFVTNKSNKNHGNDIIFNDKTFTVNAK
jgi:hypothetical protein